MCLALCWLCTATASSAIEPKIRPGYTPLGRADEQGLWMEMAEYENKVKLSALLVTDAALNEYVQDVLCNVAGDYCPDLRIYVLRNPFFNASMTAHGMVQVWTGLLLRVDSEDELAAILGHELAHYTQLHSLERLRQISNIASASLLLDMGLAVFAGIPIPVAQMTAVASVMAFSREDEREADELGLHFMAQGGYAPFAAHVVWKAVVAEEQSANVKSRTPHIFNMTHPNSESRINALKNMAESRYAGSRNQPFQRDRHVTMLNRYYLLLMEDQIDTNRTGRTEAMLERHERIGVHTELVSFFRGELYRQRGQAGDVELAIAAFSKATQGEHAVTEAWHKLAYLYLKAGDNRKAMAAFKAYLELNPDTDDRAMIEFYLQELD
jgi:predicted Zn-dependent protease